jgi:N-methylhydantoinase B
VSIERARKDYGVIVREVDADLAEFEVDAAATEAERARISAEREARLDSDPEEVARRYREGELDDMDAIRQYGVILDWGSGTLLPKTTKQFRDMLKRRTVPHWRDGLPEGARA